MIHAPFLEQQWIGLKIDEIFDEIILVDTIFDELPTLKLCLFSFG